MRIITVTCEECGSIVSGDALELQGRVVCPGVDCEVIHRFEHLSEENQLELTERANDRRRTDQ